MNKKVSYHPSVLENSIRQSIATCLYMPLSFLTQSIMKYMSVSLSIDHRCRRYPVYVDASHMTLIRKPLFLLSGASSNIWLPTFFSWTWSSLVRWWTSIVAPSTQHPWWRFPIAPARSCHAFRTQTAARTIPIPEVHMKFTRVGIWFSVQMPWCFFFFHSFTARIDVSASVGLFG